MASINCNRHAVHTSYRKTWYSSTSLPFLQPPIFHLNLFFPLSIPVSSLLICKPTPHSQRNIVNFNQKISKRGYYCNVQWGSGSTYVSNTLLIFFIEKLVCWNMRKQNKYPLKKRAVYTQTTKSLTAVTGAAQNPAECVRLGRVRATEIQTSSLQHPSLPLHIPFSMVSRDTMCIPCFET